MSEKRNDIKTTRMKSMITTFELETLHSDPNNEQAQVHEGQNENEGIDEAALG